MPSKSTYSGSRRARRASDAGGRFREEKSGEHVMVDMKKRFKLVLKGRV